MSTSELEDITPCGAVLSGSTALCRPTGTGDWRFQLFAARLVIYSRGTGTCEDRK